eukprot:TRINITY_DN14795_c0_g1_i1.p1 TRINITY_DN14795_c0_g1~~TRINITY_DN14795_c0_g1_i1.p1  ORF type:complete len:1795 (+),score=655.80 TRINITY_DN14795_c0_g1_i1:46-5430(+)
MLWDTGGTDPDASMPAMHMRTQMDMQERENKGLQEAVKRAEERCLSYEHQSADLQQRLLKVEAENSMLHESLREAHQLLEEALSDAPQVDIKLQQIRQGVRSNTDEIQQMYLALKESQTKCTEAEAHIRDLTRVKDQMQHDLQSMIVLTTDTPAEVVTPSAIRNAQAYINSLRTALATTRSQLAEAKRDQQHTPMRQPDTPDTDTSLPPPPTVRHVFPQGKMPPARLQHIRSLVDPAEMKSMLEDLLQELANAREEIAENEMNQRLRRDEPRHSLEGSSVDKELIGSSWDELLSSDEKLSRYRAKLRQTTADLALAKEEIRKLASEKDRMQVTPTTLDPESSPYVQQIMRELAEYRHETARLKDEKARLLTAVKQASAQRKAHDMLRRDISDTSSEVSYYSDSSNEGMKRGKSRGDGNEDYHTLREERDKLVDQLVSARAAAQAAELLKQDSQDERRDLLDRLEEAHAQIAELQQRIYDKQRGPPKVDMAVSPMLEFKMTLPIDGLGALPGMEQEGLDVAPAVVEVDVEEEKAQGVDEVALESLRHVLNQTQQLLERSDQQLLDERDKNALYADQLEEMRTALEKTLKEGSELQQERDALVVERDQWAQAARDADDARRKLVEHVELLQTGPQGMSDSVKTPEVADLLREKAELLVQIDILKERLADSMEELEGARRELVSSLDARSELQREQDKNADIMNSLREAEAARDKLDQEMQQMQEDAKHLNYQLDNANLVKKCSGERLEQMKRETDEMKSANDQLKRELEAQMKEIAFLCDTLTETSAQYEDCAQRLEQADAERNKLLAEKHKDLQRIEELSGKLTQVRLQNDKDAVEERKQLQTEREFDALMLADRMKELQECKDEISEVKARATKAINVLKASLQNALLQMKTLGDEFEVERSELQEKLYALDRQHREKLAEVDSLKLELNAQIKKDGTDRLRERVAALSQGLQDTKERFAEQTQAYEKCKVELRSCRKQLSENADFKSLFEEANETMERLTNKNQEFSNENRLLREQMERKGHEVETRMKSEGDETTRALREQIEHLQIELKREKDLRLRLREQNDRIRLEQEKYEKEMGTLVNDLTQQLEKKTKELSNVDQTFKNLKKQERLLRGSEETAALQPQGEEGVMPIGSDNMEARIKALEDERNQHIQDIEDLAAELQSQRDTSEELMEDVTSNLNLAKAEAEDLMRSLRRIDNIATSYAPMPLPVQQVATTEGEDEAADESGRVSMDKSSRRMSMKELPERVVENVKMALESMQAKAEDNVMISREELGHVSAEYETAKIDLAERMKKAEELRFQAQDEANTLRGEIKKYREDNSALRGDNLRLTELSQSGGALKKIVEKLQHELSDALDERDSLLQEIADTKQGKSNEVTSLLEANEMAGVAMEKMQREVANAKAEVDNLTRQKLTTEQVLEGLQKTLKDTQKSLQGSEQTVADAQQERDEAITAKDRAVRDKTGAENAIDEVREELLQTKSDFARLQAVCQDLDGLNAMVDETQDELFQTKEALAATRNELHRLRSSRDGDIDEALKVEREKMDVTLRDLMREKEEVNRNFAGAVKDRENMERGVLQGKEKTKIEVTQIEQERRHLASLLEQQQQLADERMQENDDLRKQLLMCQVKSFDGGEKKELEGLREEVAGLKMDEERLVREVQGLVEENGALRAELATNRRAGDADGLHSQLAANAGDIHSLTRQLAKMEEELRLAKGEAGSKDAELQSLRDTLEAAKQQMADHIAICEHLQAENARMKAELLSTKKELEEGRELMMSLVGPIEGVQPRASSYAPSEL